jgi:hypothetical protein
LAKKQQSEAENSTNPDTEQGRINLVKDLAMKIKNLKARSEILNRQVDRSIEASNRQEFKEQLVLMSDGLVSLKREVEILTKSYLQTVKKYEEERGRQMPVAVSEGKKDK